MTTTKLDVRQSLSRDPLEQLVNEVNQGGDAIFRAINEESIPPLMLTATGTLVVSVGDTHLTNTATGRTRSIPVINRLIPLTFTPCTVTFPAAHDGNIAISGGATVLLGIGEQDYAYVLLYLDEAGNLGAIVGTPNTSLSALTVPGIGAIRGAYIAGYVLVRCIDGAVQTIAQSNVFQFNCGGGGNPTGLTDHDELVTNSIVGAHTAMTAHIAATTDVHGVGAGVAVAGTDTAQVLINKDIDGGIASDGRRITIPKNTKANLSSLTRKAGTIVYATDEYRPYYDNGTILMPFEPDPTFGELTDLYGEITLAAGQRVIVESMDDGVVVSGFWVAGSALSEAKNFLSGCGTPNTALCIGGYTGSASDHTEKYSGAAWAASGDLPATRYSAAACGTQSAALVFGGVGPLTTTATFDGSTWAASAACGAALLEWAGCGKVNAALAIGGLTAGTTGSTQTLRFNGVTWQTTGALNTARRRAMACGTQTAAFAFGGTASTTFLTTTERFNGVSWSIQGLSMTARGGGGQSGMQSAARSLAGGTTASDSGTATATTEFYNGITWNTDASSMSVARANMPGSCGTANSALIFGGTQLASTYLSSTEHYFGSATVSAHIYMNDGVTTKTVIGPLPTTAMATLVSTTTQITLLMRNDVDKQQLLDQGYAANADWGLDHISGMFISDRFFYRVL